MADFQKVQCLFVITIVWAVKNHLQVFFQGLYSLVHVDGCCKHVRSLGQVTTWQPNMMLSSMLLSSAVSMNINFVKEQLCIKFQEVFVTTSDHPDKSPMTYFYGVSTEIISSALRDRLVGTKKKRNHKIGLRRDRQRRDQGYNLFTMHCILLLDQFCE